MAKRSQFKMSTAERQRRVFSESFKKKKVKEIERGLSKVAEICRQYEVSSTAVYRWKKLYGTQGPKAEKMIVEAASDTQELLRLKKQVAELERLIGQKQIIIDFKNKMIELAEETYGIDIKKKFSTSPSGISGK